MKIAAGAIALALSIAGAASAQVPTCNLTTPPCSSLSCREGCRMPIALMHARQSPCGEPNPGGSFDLRGTSYESTCALGTSGCSVEVPPLRFWQYDAYSMANSGCIDPALESSLVNTALDFDGTAVPGLWQLFQADWMNAEGDGCVAASQGELRTVAELSFVDRARENTIDHASWYLIGAVPLSSDFDFDLIAGSPGCSPATIAARQVGGVRIAGLSPCTGGSVPAYANMNVIDSSYADVSFVLDDPSPEYFTEEGRNPSSKPLIAGYQILYSGGTSPDLRAEPRSSDAVVGGWQPVRDPLNPAQVAGVVPWGTTSTVTVSIPRAGNYWFWLATRLVYKDATESPIGPHDPSALGPLLVSQISGHCGPIDTSIIWDPSVYLSIASDPAPGDCAAHPGDPIDFAVHYDPFLPPLVLDIEVSFGACLDFSAFSPRTIAAQVDVDGAPYGHLSSWDPVARKLVVPLSFAGPAGSGRIGIHGLRAGADTPSCCVEAYAAGGDNPLPHCLAIDSTATCGNCPTPPAVVTGLELGKWGLDQVYVRWSAASDPATVTYNVWEVTTGDKALVPVANRSSAATDPTIVNMCPSVPAASPSCILPARSAPGISFLQVRGVCADRSEGTAHPF